MQLQGLILLVSVPGTEWFFFLSSSSLRKHAVVTRWNNYFFGISATTTTTTASSSSFAFPTNTFVSSDPTSRFPPATPDTIYAPVILQDFDLIVFSDKNDVVADAIAAIQDLSLHWRKYFPADKASPTPTHVGLFVTGPTAVRLAANSAAKWPLHVPLPDATGNYVLESTLSGPLNDGVYDCAQRIHFGVQLRPFLHVITARGSDRSVFVGKLLERAHVDRLIDTDDDATLWRQLASYLCVGYDYGWFAWGRHLWRRYVAGGVVTEDNADITLKSVKPDAMLCSRMCAEIYKDLGIWKSTTLQTELAFPCDLVFPLDQRFLTHPLRRLSVIA